MLLKHYLEQGVSKAELSRRFRVNRQTINYRIETDRLDRDLSAGTRGYAPRATVAHKLDPYMGITEARLAAFRKLSAKRLFDEVRAAGYPGSYERVRDYVRATRPRDPVGAPVRFETPSGRQGQVDFETFTLPWGRRRTLGGRCANPVTHSSAEPDYSNSASGGTSPSPNCEIFDCQKRAIFSCHRQPCTILARGCLPFCPHTHTYVFNCQRRRKSLVGNTGYVRTM